MIVDKDKKEMVLAMISLGKAREALGIVRACPLKWCPDCLKKIEKEEARLKYYYEKAGEIFVAMGKKKKEKP